MSELRPIPKNMSRLALCEILQDIRLRVQEGDSFEGNITWMMPEDEHADPDSFDVLGAYRVGNRMGQGGMRFINDGFREVEE